MSSTTTDEISIKSVHDTVVEIKEKLTTIRDGETEINTQAWIIFGISVVLVILSTVIPIIIVEVKEKKNRRLFRQELASVPAR